MGKITGNDNDFPTIKQVNDALTGSNSTLDISAYATELFELKDTKYVGLTDSSSASNEYLELTSPTLIELFDKINNTKPSLIYGKGLWENSEIEFTTNYNLCVTKLSQYNNYNYIISFKIYLIAYGFVYNFVVFKMLDSYFYHKSMLEGISFL